MFGLGSVSVYGESLLESSERVIARHADKKLIYSAGQNDVATVRIREKEKFWSPTNLVLSSVWLGATAADVDSTFRVLKRCASCYEANPIVAPLLKRGPALTWTVITGVTLADVELAHELRRSDHKTLRIIGWAVPIVATGLHTWAAIHNHQLIK